MKLILSIMILGFCHFSFADSNENQFYNKIMNDSKSSRVCELQIVEDSLYGIFGTLTCDGQRMTSDKLIPPGDASTLMTGSLAVFISNGFKLISCESLVKKSLGSSDLQPTRRCLLVK